MGAGAGVGVGARATACTTMVDGAGAAAGGSETGAAPDEVTPSSSETSFGGAVLPEKNSAAESAGSAEGAGG